MQHMDKRTGGDGAAGIAKGRRRHFLPGREQKTLLGYEAKTKQTKPSLRVMGKYRLSPTHKERVVLEQTIFL